MILDFLLDPVFLWIRFVFIALSIALTAALYSGSASSFFEEFRTFFMWVLRVDFFETFLSRRFLSCRSLLICCGCLSI